MFELQAHDSKRMTFHFGFMVLNNYWIEKNRDFTKFRFLKEIWVIYIKSLVKSIKIAFCILFIIIILLNTYKYVESINFSLSIILYYLLLYIHMIYNWNVWSQLQGQMDRLRIYFFDEYPNLEIVFDNFIHSELHNNNFTIKATLRTKWIFHFNHCLRLINCVAIQQSSHIHISPTYSAHYFDLIVWNMH